MMTSPTATTPAPVAAAVCVRSPMATPRPPSRPATPPTNSGVLYYVHNDPLGTYAYVGGNPLKSIDPFGLNQMDHGPVGPQNCRRTCITDFIGGGLLASAAGLGFGAIAGSGAVASTVGTVGSSANNAYSAFNLAACPLTVR